MKALSAAPALVIVLAMTIEATALEIGFGASIDAFNDMVYGSAEIPQGTCAGCAFTSFTNGIAAGGIHTALVLDGVV